jgi:hypothetical protein
MELEEMKALWGEMSAEMDKQKKLTDTLIIKMTQVNYNNKVSKIFVPEAISSVLCFAMAGFIVLNMGQLNTWDLMLSGIVSALILVVNPALSLNSLFRIRALNISANSYKESLLQYSQGKKQFVRVKKINLLLGAVLLLVCLPTFSQLIAGKDIFKTHSVWYWYVIFGPIYYWIVTRWISRCYNNVLSGAEKILKEIEA